MSEKSSNKIVVDVDEVIANANQRRAWNNLNLEDIAFEYDGRIIEIPEHIIEQWNIVGLSNVDFILDYKWPDNPLYNTDSE